MKIAILAGGLGTRLSEYTKTIPKPMVKIGKFPILVHIMNIYLKHGYKDFYILVGYKSYVVKKFFKNFKKFNLPFEFKFKNFSCFVTLIDSGKSAMTGGRLKKMNFFLKKNENFMFTYGDGISNVNIKQLINFHKKKNKLITVTAVRPPARFGELTMKNNFVTTFKEKPQTGGGWINGGFFITNKNFLGLIRGNKTILEKEPLEKASRSRELVAYKHYGFWKCMDTLRDKQVLEEMLKKKYF